VGVARAVALDMHRLIVSGMHEEALAALAALAVLASLAAARGFLPDRRIAAVHDEPEAARAARPRDAGLGLIG